MEKFITYLSKRLRCLVTLSPLERGVFFRLWGPGIAPWHFDRHYFLRRCAAGPEPETSASARSSLVSDPVGGNVRIRRRRRSRRHGRNRSIRRWLATATIALCVGIVSAVALQYLSPSLF